MPGKELATGAGDGLPTFAPGTELKLLGVALKASPVRASVQIEFPHRIHVTPIDCNRFALGQPGGGGLGFAISHGSTLRVASAGRFQIASIRSKDPPVAEHYLRLIQAIMGTHV